MDEKMEENMHLLQICFVKNKQLNTFPKSDLLKNAKIAISASIRP